MTTVTISFPVYAELRTGQGWSLIGAFLEGLGIRLRPEIPLPIWELAGERFGLYAQKRRKTSLPRRILADFLVGSHALYHGLSLATFDPGPYRLAFPELEVVP